MIAATWATRRRLSVATAALAVAASVSLGGCSLGGDDSASGSSTPPGSTATGTGSAGGAKTASGPVAPTASLDADAIVITGDMAAFLTPSGNTACVVRAESVTCQIDQLDFEPDADDVVESARERCRPEKADAMTVVVGGDPGWTCVHDELADSTTRDIGGGWVTGKIGAKEGSGRSARAVLPYGSSLRLGEMECASDETGISCEDTTTGRGFTLAREQYSID